MNSIGVGICASERRSGYLYEPIRDELVLTAFLLSPTMRRLPPTNQIALCGFDNLARPQARCAYGGTPDCRTLADAYLLEIGQKTAFRSVVGVTHILSDLRLLAANTALCHGIISLISISRIGARQSRLI